ncbi:MAG: [glutamine synthetase] adenylyltransferase / [glutamine synthetase]-adenylyl-L-tyrosine, partial [Actinomycetota bacterium]|nr:[glutamine synthetase] adenylyltransferase / [glutamine synthetase]-adenylyl-L-tyrosine [Actinomycetota bacterium]
IANADLNAGAVVQDITAALADVADAVLDASLAIARGEVPGHEQARLGIVAMGKCGARELNYLSDVDVIFVAEPVAGVEESVGLRIATQIAQRLMNVTVASTIEGSIWEVDAGLRPEGKSGALVRTLTSHQGYYERWAKTWEFQALLKARAAAGDLELARAFVADTRPGVWSASRRPDFVGDVQQMRRRVEQNIPAKHAGRELKLGPGGLRDIEFSVQMLQMVHGASDITVRAPATLTALEQLATWGYVGREDAQALAEAYAFQRTLEHRLQLRSLRRTHMLPEAPEDLRWLGRSIGLQSDPAEELLKRWRSVSLDVRRLHEKLFYRPLLDAVAKLEPGQARLTPEAAQDRLTMLGYRDPAGALRHLQTLSSGVSRRAAIQRTLLPVMLGWFAAGPDPDSGLLGFRQVSDSLGSTPWYLRLLRDESAVAERLALLLSTSRYSSELLMRAPEAVRILADTPAMTSPDRGALVAEMRAVARRYDHAEAAIVAVRAVRRRELFRVSVADLVGLLDVADVAESLSDVADATIDAALGAAVAQVERERGSVLPTRLLIVAMGRLGGRDMSYASDADVMFVHDPLPGADEQDAAEAARGVFNLVRAGLAAASPDPPLPIDADLRPEGRQGPLVRTLASYRAYYRRFSAPWEAQALLRARPLAGSEALAEEFLTVIDPVRYPAAGLSPTDLVQIRRLKARMESERLPRGVDPRRHTKLGPGGLSDVEWVVQIMQQQHGHDVLGLRATGTVPAMSVAVSQDLIKVKDAETLMAAWKLASRVRNANTLVLGKPSDVIPSDVRDIGSVSRVLGYPPGHASDMLEDYFRTARRARKVFDRLFFDAT